MKKRMLTVISLLLILSLAAAFTPAARASAPAQQLARNETLYVAGFQWSTPANFNILNGNPDWPSQGGYEEIYESLFAYNQLKNSLDPMLAKDLKIVDATTMQVTL